MNSNNIEIEDISKVPDAVKAPDMSSEVKKNLDHSENNKIPISILDFNEISGYLDAWKSVDTLETFASTYVKKMRSPTTKKDFMPYTEPASRSGVPCLGRNYAMFSTTQGATPRGTTNFVNFTYNIDNMVAYLHREPERLKVQVLSSFVQSYLAAATTVKEQQLVNGGRMVRSNVSYVIGDWGCVLTEPIDTTFRNVRTDLIAQWMYGSYTATTPAETLYIINFSDLRNYLNTNVNTCPVPQDTLCLNLKSGWTDSEYGLLSLFQEDVIIDFSSSVTTNNTYNGVPARAVSKLSASPLDPICTTAIERTCLAEDVDLAIYINAFPLTAYSFTSSNVFHLHTYRNTIQDQTLAFFGIQDKNECDLHSQITYKIQNFRVFKTAAMQLSRWALGGEGYSAVVRTTGKAVDNGEVCKFIFGAWENVSTTIPSIFSYAWIPWEYWIANGADLELDDDELVTSMSGYDINSKCRVPRSTVPLNVTEYNTFNRTTPTYIYYYIPNQAAYLFGDNGGTSSDERVCFPQTVHCINSLCNTASIPFNPDHRIIVKNTRKGKNDKYLTVRALDF